MCLKKSVVCCKNGLSYGAQRQREQNDWLLGKHCKITKALLKLKTGPHTIILLVVGTTD